MSNQRQPSQESRAGDGVQLSVTEARAGVRRGVSKVMVISTLLAIMAMVAIWLLMAHQVHQAPQTPHPPQAPALAIPSQADAHR
jgi:hypothetical protein